MKYFLLLICVIPLITGCIYDPNEAHQTPEGYYKWGFDAYTFWYNPHSNVTYEVKVDFMGKTYELAPNEVMVANPQSQSVLFKIWRFESDWAKEAPLKIALGRGVKSKYVWWPPGTQLRIEMIRGGRVYEPIFWTLE